MSCYLNPEYLDRVARDTKFIQRKGKISADTFINTLIFSELNQSKTSLLDLTCDMQEHYHCNVSKVALHKRFTPEATSFLKHIFSDIMLDKIQNSELPTLPANRINRIRVKDSTKFRLPLSMIEDYPGYGSYNKKSSLMNIQYELDLITGSWLNLELTKATRNDQKDSKETINDIEENDLCIRDLGYVTVTYLEGIIEKKHFTLIDFLPQWEFTSQIVILHWIGEKYMLK